MMMAVRVRTSMRGMTILSFIIIALVSLCNVRADSETCLTGDGTCGYEESDIEENIVDPEQEATLRVRNDSPYRADVYWDDGNFGVNLATVEADGGEEGLNTFTGHKFFITRHGMRQAIINPDTKKQYKFEVTRLNQMVTITNDATLSDEKCQDRFSSCEQMAASGQCWQSPGWMIVHCCESCDEDLDSRRLIDPSIRCSKEHLNITDPAWEPGDLNKLFTEWATAEEFQALDPVILSSPNADYGGIDGPWVLTFDNFLTNNEADALIEGGRMEGFQRSTDQGAVNEIGETEKLVSTGRTSSNAWCLEKCESNPEVQGITRRIEYVTGIPKNNYENFQILEYGNNQFYNMHHDEKERDESPCGPRILTFFLYLSDVEEGGETRFNKLGIDVKPKKGRALVWPSVSNNDPTYWDDRMYHEAMPVKKGTKYAANHWIHLNDFVAANFWGCTGSFS